MSTSIMWIMDLVKTKTRPWRHIYHDIGITRPKGHDIEFLWNSDPYAPLIFVKHRTLIIPSIQIYVVPLNYG